MIRSLPVVLFFTLLSEAMLLGAEDPFKAAKVDAPGHCPICVLKTDGSELRVVADLGKGRYGGSPMFSSDNKHIAFDAWLKEDSGATQAKVFVVDIATKKLKELTTGSMPCWIPKDGDVDSVAFFRHGRDFGLWVVDLKGEGLKRLNQNGNCPRFSPDGKSIAYNRLGGSGGIVVTNLADGEHKLIAPNQSADGRCTYMHGFAWSPDGKKIVAQVKYPNDTYEVHIVDAESLEIDRRIMQTANNFSWSPDGKRILFTTKVKGEKFSQLFTFDVEGDKPPTKVVGQPKNRDNEIGGFSSDGKWIVFSSALSPKE